MSAQLEIDPDKIVHEENYKVNLGNGGQEEILLPTQLNTQENNIISQPFAIEKNRIMTEVFLML